MSKYDEVNIMRVCYIQKCYQCPHCNFDSEYAFDNEGHCTISNKEINNVCDNIPEWCMLVKPYEDK